ncbi:hypothetical protein NQ317_002146 [Molorchus minor]|uniref:Uncharacterized protein n=1 Tax=Molorchus minor TaxID=1323400 RepID=A0ABQ9JVP9_9CUCU|nr:hypothetical protein NQ317_002146 [Molorchus minor]
MKNTDKSPHIHFPKVPPEKAVADYKRSQKFHSIPTLYPEFDVVHHNDPKSNLALLQIKLRDTEDILAKKRHQQRETRADLNRQWETLDEKESQLRENFITFNTVTDRLLLVYRLNGSRYNNYGQTFVQENMEKRERAERKIIEELALIEQRDEDIKKHIARYVDFSQEA